ncbi:hypothetical protein BN77_p11553 [Rhizobium mesoamericanum STM3625]|uniref:Uncharacterized protein n=1 Tax=Rhizobium mesoamericanum STM3625 TaxID=1211777 RepID=K0PY55_9HYPH|nr:hypothetical protein BN77_p11553 [Rhizobium mesoamericanum STM3625]
MDFETGSTILGPARRDRGQSIKLQANRDEDAEGKGIAHPTVKAPQWPRQEAAPAAL